MHRPTHRDDDTGLRWLRPLLIRGGLLLAMVVVIGTLAGWTDRVRATELASPPTARETAMLATRMGNLSDQLVSARGEMSLMRLQLDRATAVIRYSTTYQIPADLAGAIYDVALSEGIDPALGFRLVKIESEFKRNARSAAGAIGYTQVQVATARFYQQRVTEGMLYDRDLNLRLGFRFLNDLMQKFGGDARLALLAYNRGPAKVADILAHGGDPANGYDVAVLRGYRR